MFLAPRQRKTTVFTRFWASASKNHSIYSVLWPGPGKNTGIYAVSCMLSEAFFGCQRHKNIVNYTIFTRGQYQKIMKNWSKTDQKTPNKDLQNASAIFTIFSPTPNPQKRENPSRLKDFRGGSAAPAHPRVAKAMLSNHHRTASPDLRAYARQPARGPTMLAHLVAMLAYVGLSCGLCWPSLGLCWTILKAMWVDREAYVGRSWGLCWPMLSQKIRKMGTAKKHCKTQDILMVGGLSWGYVGLSWGQHGRILGLGWPILGLGWPILGAMLAHLGAMLAHLGGYVGPSWGYVGPSWGLCWPMLTHLEPHVRCLCKNMLNVTGPRNTVNYRGFCRHAHPTRGRRLGRRPLSPTERRELPYGNATARGPLAGFKRLRATAGQGPNHGARGGGRRCSGSCREQDWLLWLWWLWLWLWWWLWWWLWLWLWLWLAVGCCCCCGGWHVWVRGGWAGVGRSGCVREGLGLVGVLSTVCKVVGRCWAMMVCEVRWLWLWVVL